MAEKRKSAKHGRNANWCKAYRLSARREFNKATRLAKHLRRFGGDACAIAALNKCKVALSLGQLRLIAKLEPAKAA